MHSGYSLPAGRIPDDVAVLGRLTVVKIRTEGGGEKAIQPTWRGKRTCLATDASGRDFYILPAPKWGPFRGQQGEGVAAMATRFHGKKANVEALVRYPRDIPEGRKSVGEVTEVVYEPWPGSPKANYSWVHEVGDIGSGRSVDTQVLLTRAKGRWFFDITKRSGRYPVITSRGIEG